jgi:hypothetical protein
MGCTDEPFCSMSCPQCFVRRGQSGVEGRQSISIAPNAKQTGFGQAHLGDQFRGTIGLLQGVARQQDAPVNYLSRFLAQPQREQMDMSLSLMGSGLLPPNNFLIMRREIAGTR